jgi:hypothetical protein
MSTEKKPGVSHPAETLLAVHERNFNAIVNKMSPEDRELLGFAEDNAVPAASTPLNTHTTTKKRKTVCLTTPLIPPTSGITSTSSCEPGHDHIDSSHFVWDFIVQYTSGFCHEEYCGVCGRHGDLGPLPQSDQAPVTGSPQLEAAKALLDPRTLHYFAWCCSVWSGWGMGAVVISLKYPPSDIHTNQLEFCRYVNEVVAQCMFYPDRSVRRILSFTGRDKSRAIRDAMAPCHIDQPTVPCVPLVIFQASRFPGQINKFDPVNLQCVDNRQFMSSVLVEWRYLPAPANDGFLADLGHRQLQRVLPIVMKFRAFISRCRSEGCLEAAHMCRMCDLVAWCEKHSSGHDASNHKSLCTCSNGAMVWQKQSEHAFLGLLKHDKTEPLPTIVSARHIEPVTRIRHDQDVLLSRWPSDMPGKGIMSVFLGCPGVFGSIATSANDDANASNDAKYPAVKKPAAPVQAGLKRFTFQGDAFTAVGQDIHPTIARRVRRAIVLEREKNPLETVETTRQVSVALGDRDNLQFTCVYVSQLNSEMRKRIKQDLGGRTPKFLVTLDAAEQLAKLHRD